MPVTFSRTVRRESLKYQILSVAYGFTYQSVTGWTSPYPGFVPF